MMIHISPAAWPVPSDIAKCRDEFEHRVRERRCEPLQTAVASACS